MVTQQSDEVERKYDVDDTAILPTWTGLGDVTRTAPAVEMEMEAVYFDTADLALASRGITVRRRTGGQDDGWHVKLPRAADTRTELRAPLGRSVRTVPKPVRTPLLAAVRGRRLVPVARVATRRRLHELVDRTGTVLAHVCDDTVHTTRLLDPAEDHEWREWEVELVDGPTTLLDALEDAVLRAGGRASTVGSKLARALDGSVERRPGPPDRARLRRATAGDLLRHHLTAQVVRLEEQDRRVRMGEASAIHKMRIAIRRLRSALRTYEPLLDPEPIGAVRDELRWLGLALSPARDAQVLRERLEVLVDDQPDELVLGPVAADLHDDLVRAERAGRDRALEALDDPRYIRLLEQLDALAQTLPLRAGVDADQSARDVLPGLVRKDAKRLRRAVRAIDRAEPGPERDLALHEARKKAKRLRYAAELGAPVLGKPATKLASSTKQVQQALGEHQDTVMARALLREHGARSHVAGRNGFTFGRLHALEEARAEASSRDFERAWNRLETKRLARWLQA